MYLCIEFLFISFVTTASLVSSDIESAFEEDNFHLLQEFVHPNITLCTPLDPAPFEPPGESDKGFSGVRGLCKCGIRNELSGSQGASVVEPKVFDPQSARGAELLIAEGTEAEVNEYPWVVALVYNVGNGTKVHFCGGTLISSRHVLTATHCLQGKSVAKTEVWLNGHDILLSTERGGTLPLKASRFIVHPKYNPIMQYNDISVIEIAEEVDIVLDKFRPICLPKANEDPWTRGAKGMAAGWGQTHFMGPKSSKLLKVSLPIIESSECKMKSESYYQKRLTDHMICAGDIQNGGGDTCPGDSGGPLFVKQGSKYVLVGVVSWGYRCGEPKRPGVYTRVSKYVAWINREASQGGRRCLG